jgi:hypothetical protein
LQFDLRILLAKGVATEKTQNQKAGKRRFPGVEQGSRRKKTRRYGVHATPMFGAQIRYSMFSRPKSKINLGATGTGCVVVAAVTESSRVPWKQSAGAIFTFAVTKSDEM